MEVKAAPGLRVPREGQARKYIGNEFVIVPDSAYYRRLVKDGSLVRKSKKQKPAEQGGEK